MKIENVPVSAIRRAPYNPRKDLQPSDPEYQRIKASLGRWGSVQPLVWNRTTGNLVAGHQRLKIQLAEDPSITALEVSVVELNDVEEKALNLALNRITGDWDLPKLGELLTQLNDPDVFPTLDLTGFGNDDLAELMNDATKPLFAPVLIPQLDARDVTDADMLKASATVGKFGTQERQLQDMVCPHCGKEFQVDGH